MFLTFQDIFNKIDENKTKLVFHYKYSDKECKENEIDAWSLLQDEMRKEHSEEYALYANPKDRWFEMNYSCISQDPTEQHLIVFVQYLDYGENYFVFGGYYVYKKSASKEEQLCRKKEYDEYRGSLIVRLTKKIKGKNYRFYYKTMKSNLPEVYAFLPYDKGIGAFRGYDNVRLMHRELNSIFHNEEGAADWQSALSKIKAVYCITDISNGKMYVGSANSVNGLWARWNEYANEKVLTGENKYFEKLVADDPVYLKASGVTNSGKEHIRTYFQYTILQVFDIKTATNVVTERERFWKDAFRTVVNENDDSWQTKKGMNFNR